MGAALVASSAGALVATQFVTTRCYTISWHAESALREVPIVSSQHGLDERIRRREPALLHDALHDWPAAQKWSPAWFGTHHTMRHRRVEVYFWGQTGADWQRLRIFEITLGEFARMVATHAKRVLQLGRVDAGPAPYLQEDESLFDEYSELLLPDVMHLPYRPHVTSSGAGRDARMETAFWMGPSGARTGIHWDSVDGLLHQLHGAKRVRLWPPSARESLYPSSRYNHGAELSLVDASSPNLTLFPRFGELKPISIVLSAGSALFVPSGWWHAVDSLDATISLSLRSQGTCEARAALVDDALLWLHRHGLYREGYCVCHPPPSQTDASDAAKATEAAIDALMQEAGIDAGEAEL